MLHNIHIHRLWHCIRNTSCQYQDISIDCRSLSIDFCLFLCTKLYIDSGCSLSYMNEIGRDSFFFQQSNNLPARKSSHKSQRCILASKIFQYHRNVDSFSSRKNNFLTCSIYNSCHKIINCDNVIQRWIKCYCINHLFYLHNVFIFFQSGLF